MGGLKCITSKGRVQVYQAMEGMPPNARHAHAPDDGMSMCVHNCQLIKEFHVLWAHLSLERPAQETLEDASVHEWLARGSRGPDGLQIDRRAVERVLPQAACHSVHLTASDISVQQCHARLCLTYAHNNAAIWRDCACTRPQGNLRMTSGEVPCQAVLAEACQNMTRLYVDLKMHLICRRAGCDGLEPRTSKLKPEAPMATTSCRHRPSANGERGCEL